MSRSRPSTPLVCVCLCVSAYSGVALRISEEGDICRSLVHHPVDIAPHQQGHTVRRPSHERRPSYERRREAGTATSQAVAIGHLPRAGRVRACWAARCSADGSMMRSKADSNRLREYFLQLTAGILLLNGILVSAGSSKPSKGRRLCLWACRLKQHGGEFESGAVPAHFTKPSCGESIVPYLSHFVSDRCIGNMIRWTSQEMR